MSRISRTRPAATALALGAFLTLGAGDVRASGEDVIGLGPRSAALAGSGAALSEGFEATHTNPALLSLARERELSVGLTSALFDLEADRDLDYRALRALVVGGSFPIPFGGKLEDRVGLGFAFFTPAQMIARTLYTDAPQMPIGDRTQSLGIRFAVGLDLGYGLRLGVGTAVLATLTGTVTVGTDSSGQIGTILEEGLVASYAPVIGASFDLGKSYRVGVTYRGALTANTDVAIVVKDLGPLQVPELNIGGIAQYDPHQVALELARHSGAWRGAIGITYKHWQAYPGPVEATVSCPALTDPDQQVTCELLEPEKVDYAPVLVPRLAVERLFGLRRGLDLAARGGYFFEASPYPPQSKQSRIYDNARSVVTLGAGLKLAEPLPPIGFDLFGQVHLLHPREHAKEPGFGRPGEVVTSRGVIVALGGTAAVRF